MKKIFLIVLLNMVILDFVEAKEKKLMNTNLETKTMKIISPKELEAVQGSADNFTGNVKVKMLAQGEEPSNLGSALVSFETGAHSAWHTHPKGQLLIVTEGSGIVQEWGKPARKIEIGDVIWTPPNVKHWHGACSDCSMSHIAVQESLNGSPVNWMEKVSDEQYKAAK